MSIKLIQTSTFARVVSIIVAATIVAVGPVAALAETKKALPSTAKPAGATIRNAAVPSGTFTATESTPVKVAIQQQLKSGDSKEGTAVEFLTTSDIFDSNHVLLVPSGTQAFGTVKKSQGHGAWGKSGKLDFTCDYVLAPDGTKVPLRSQSMAAKGKDNTAALVGGILALGVFGGFVKGRDVTILPDTEFTMYVDKDTTLPASGATPQPAVATAKGFVAGGVHGMTLGLTGKDKKKD